MATKPLIINAGRFEQLSDGAGLDVGGWTLPTAGGTDGYPLVANSSGNAVWSTVLDTLTLLTVDNITIDGAVITSDTGVVSIDDPVSINSAGASATWDLQVGDDNALIRLGEGNYTSHTVIGNKQKDEVDANEYETYFADNAYWDSTGLEWLPVRSALGRRAKFSMGYSQAAFLWDYQSSDGATITWTELMSLDYSTGTLDVGSFTTDTLTVDNITIDAATITSDTGAISFVDEDLNTTGDISADALVLSGSIMHDLGADATCAYSNLLFEGGSNNETGTLVIDLPVDFDNTMMAIRINGYNYTAVGAWSVLIGGYTYNVNGVWLSYHASVQGNPPFSEIRLGYNGNTSKACIMLGATDTAWRYPQVQVAEMVTGLQAEDTYASGWAMDFYTDETNFYNNDPSYTDPVTVPWNKDFPAPSATNQVLQATGDKVAAWSTDLTGLTSLVVDNITINAFSITSDTGTVSFGDDHVFTLATVIGTNIPSPAVDNQVLISTATDIAAWSTAGNDQYLASDGSGEVAWIAKPVLGSNPTADDQLLVATGVDAASWTDTLDILKVDNITIDAATITSDTGAISFVNENLSTSGTVTGTNIPSPTADDQALSSTASGVASWNATCLADILAQEVPTATGAERKYVITADSASKFEIESAPWTLNLYADETIYVRTTGNDTTGDGTFSTPFLTLTRTIEYLGGLYIGDYNVTVDIGEGVFTEGGTLTFMHPFGSQVTWEGVSEQLTSQTAWTIGTTGYSLGHSNLYYYEVTFVLPVGKSVSVGDYIAIRSASTATRPESLQGCHYVSGWVSGTRTATIQVVYRNGAPKAVGAIVCTLELIKTVIAFDNKNGLKISGPYYGGIWKGLVIQGNYSSTNTSAKYGVWMLNTAGVTVGGADTDGWGTAVVGFQNGFHAQNNALIFGDYSFVSKCGLRCAGVNNGGVLNLRWARLSGANNSGIFAYNGSAVSAQGVQIVAVGNESAMAYQGSFVDVTSSFVDHNNATNALTADRWSGLDGTSASYSDALSPSSNPGNDGSYIIT